MRRSRAGLLTLGLACLAAPPAARAEPHIHWWHDRYDIRYDEQLVVRSVHVPPSEKKGRALTAKELDALRDHGEPGYRATADDLALAQTVTIYPEKETIDAKGKVTVHDLPPVTGVVTFFQANVNHLVVGRDYPVVVTVCQSHTFEYQIGLAPGRRPRGTVLDGVRVKRVLIRTYHPPR